MPRNKNYLEIFIGKNVGWNYHLKDKLKREQNNTAP